MKYSTWMRANDIFSTWMGANDIYSTQMRPNNIGICIFLRFIEKWLKKTWEVTENWLRTNGKYHWWLLMTDKTHYHLPFMNSQSLDFLKQSSPTTLSYSILSHSAQLNPVPSCSFALEWESCPCLKHYTRLERPAKDKSTSLLGPFVSYEENKVLWILLKNSTKILSKF